MMYRLVTGWYPSRQTAERILKNVKAKKKNSEILELKEGFCVSLFYSNFYKDCEIMKEKCLNKGIYCGIEAVREN